MYKTILMLTGILLAIEFILLFMRISMTPITGSVMAAMLGVSGNRLYIQHVQKKIALIKKICPSPDQQKAALEKTGGVSWWGVGIALLIVAGFVMVNILFEMIYKHIISNSFY